jgi:hypothetical protein
MLRGSGLNFIPADGMQEAASQVVQAAGGVS